MVILADGGNYCACVNAATLALIDAGIPLRDYVTACTASLVDDKPLVDISSLESTQGGPELTVVSIKITLSNTAIVEIRNTVQLYCGEDELIVERHFLLLANW